MSEKHAKVIVPVLTLTVFMQLIDVLEIQISSDAIVVIVILTVIVTVAALYQAIKS